MAGATLGGGIGWYSSMYGAISDSLKSAEIVTGTGELLTVSDCDYPDLFWAIKGAGSSYGVVTSLTYNVYPSPNDGQVLNVDMKLPISQSQKLWEFSKSLVPSAASRQPKELSLIYSYLWDRASSQVSVSSSLPESSRLIIICSFKSV